MWERGAGRKLAGVGILMNVLVPPIGFILAPLYAYYFMMSGMP